MKVDRLAGASLSKIKVQKEIDNTGGLSFEKVKKEITNFISDKNSPINDIEKSLLSNNHLSGKDLLSLQIRASNYHMKVEVVTKVAESFVSTTKRLQQVQ